MRAGLLLIFARAPVPGRVKTRLIPALGPAGAARLHRALLERTLRAAGAQRLMKVELWTTPDAPPEFLRDCRRRGLTVRVQQGRDLGARMHRALVHALRRAPWAVLAGTDCMDADAAHLARAARLLRGGLDAVLGPVRDGGYWLVGLRRPCPALFRDMPWGTGRVARLTRRRLARAGRRRAELPVRHDLDRPRDLGRLVSRKQDRPAVASPGTGSHAGAAPSR